jgi:hypothetical protein
LSEFLIFIFLIRDLYGGIHIRPYL